ncbi:hypothetical protein H4R23_005917 [Coemansia sp. Cherry 401B]|nr:hypothetical protein H4R23_005917 [Coemansia sp. Cherry 401B]
MMVSSTRPLTSTAGPSPRGDGSCSQSAGCAQQDPSDPQMYSLIQQLFNTAMVCTASSHEGTPAVAPSTQPPCPTSDGSSASVLGGLLAGIHPANPAFAGNNMVPASLRPQYDAHSGAGQPPFPAFPGSHPMAPYGIPLGPQPSPHDSEMLALPEPSSWSMLSASAGPSVGVLSPPANIAQVIASGSPGGAVLSSDTIGAQNPLLATYAAPHAYYPPASLGWHQSAPTTAYGESHSHYQSPTGSEFPTFPLPLRPLSATQSPTNNSFLLSGMANPAGAAPAQTLHFPAHGQSELRRVADRSFGALAQSIGTSLSPSPSRALLTGSDNDDSESNQESDVLVGPFRAEGSWKNQPRNSISRKQKKAFYRWLLDNTRFPFPSETERLSQLAVDLVSEKQFKYWFANIRCRQFTKHRDAEGNLYFAPNAKFYESCIRLGLAIQHEIPADVRRDMKHPRKHSMRRM